MKEALKLFIQDIKNEEYREAHEHLELEWRVLRKAKNPDAKILKGFINGASAFELVKRGKVEGARKLWGTHMKYLTLLKEDIVGYEMFLEADVLLQALAKERL